MNGESFFEKGWLRFEYDPALAEWVRRALPSAREAVPADENTRWLRCGGTWFVGVNVLPNDSSGAVGGSGSLRGRAIRFSRQSLGISGFEWDRGQISVCHPGYPQPMESESAAAFAYRRDRDAAHVDGLLPEGVDRRRHLREYHGFILGTPMVEFSADASPFVVWEGSHEMIRAAVSERFAGLPPSQWGDEDITEVYHQIRQAVFERCERVEIAVKPGEAFIAHRLVLHGVAPWAETATAGEDGRMICYFRPIVGGPEEWLEAL
jgi:hypothetical protein